MAGRESHCWRCAVYRLRPASRRAGRAAVAHTGSDTPAMRTVTHSVVQRQHIDASRQSHHTALAGEDTRLGQRGPGTGPPRPAGAGTRLGIAGTGCCGMGQPGELGTPRHPCVWHWKAPGHCALAPMRDTEGLQSPWCRAMAWMMQKIPSGPTSQSGAGCRPSSLIFQLSKASFSRSGQRLADPAWPRPTAAGLEPGFEAGFFPADHGYGSAGAMCVCQDGPGCPGGGSGTGAEGTDWFL